MKDFPTTNLKLQPLGRVSILVRPFLHSEQKMNWLLLLLSMFLFRVFGYHLLGQFIRLVCHTYFRQIEIRGVNNIPREGPVIICPNHPNMLVDALLVVSEMIKLGRGPYCWAKGSLFKNPIVSHIIRSLGAVPVYRPPTSSTDEFKDSDKTPEELAAATETMFEHSWKVLQAGNVMVLFPEGTSYTQTHMMELKTGVMRVATGFVKKYAQPISIIPCGITYFKKDKFRSSVLMEFGQPIVVDTDSVSSERYAKDQRAVIKDMTKNLKEQMHNVTLNAPTVECLDTARAFRRLCLSNPTVMTAQSEVKVTRDIIRILTATETSPQIEILVKKVKEYERQLKELQITDHDVLHAGENEPYIGIILERMVYLLILLPLGAPGFIVNVPFYILVRKLNAMAGYVEEKSSMKIAATAILVPIQWVIIVFLSWLFVGSFTAQVVTILLPVMLYSHIRVLEEGVSTLHLIRSLLNIQERQENISKLQETRKGLVDPVQELIRTNAAVEQLVSKSDPAKKLSLRTRQMSRFEIAL